MRAARNGNLIESLGEKYGACFVGSLHSANLSDRRAVIFLRRVLRRADVAIYSAWRNKYRRAELGGF